MAQARAAIGRPTHSFGTRLLAHPEIGRSAYDDDQPVQGSGPKESSDGAGGTENNDLLQVLRSDVTRHTEHPENSRWSG